jgi:hypothetical protein
MAFRWLGDEAEAQRLQQEQTYHYVDGPSWLPSLL